MIERTLRTTPVDATHWSIRSMAAETGFSHTTIRRMWAAFGLQPHRSQLSPPNRARPLTRKKLPAEPVQARRIITVPRAPQRRLHAPQMLRPVRWLAEVSAAAVIEHERISCTSNRDLALKSH